MVDPAKAEEMKRRLNQARARSFLADAKTRTQPAAPVSVPSDQDVSAGDIWGDAWRSVATGVRSGLETIPGTIGDMQSLKHHLAQLITAKMPLGGVTDKVLSAAGRAEQFINPLSRLAEYAPTTETVANATDAAVNALPESVSGPINAVTRHESTTPFGQGWGGATELATSFIDPVVLAAKGPAVAERFLRTGEKVLDPLARLPGAPSHVEGPVPEVVKAAEDYAQGAGINLTRQKDYAVADPRRGRYIANAYEKMPHDPADPRVKQSYEALARETMAQFDAMQKAGAKIEFIKPGMPDPYPGGPREALADLRANHHLWVFPTDQGFGSINQISDNPLLAPTGINVGGHDMVVNDAFRAVHDYFGHGMEGANFGARGEENAWRAHSRLFSPEALPAATSETRGQNSWVNFGPYGDANRANQRATVFADQKTGIMPGWTAREGGMPLSYRAQQVALPAALVSALALAGSQRRQ